MLGCDFLRRLRFSHCSRQPASDFVAALREILGHVVENLGASVGGGLGPARRFAGGFDGVANVFAIAQRRFAEQLGRSGCALPCCSRNRAAPACRRCRALRCGRSAKIGRLVGVVRGLLRRRSPEHGSAGARLEPRWLQIFQQAFPAALAAVAAFAIAAESAGGVEQVGAIDPDHAGFDLRRNVQRNVDALAPHAGGEAVHRVVGQFDRFGWACGKSWRPAPGPKISCCATIDVGCTLLSKVGGK